MISIIREKQKRKRNRINKKWTSEEIRYILNYLENSTEIEAPTAQIYYRKFISETGINATWDLIRWKVKHLKSTYKKAKDWRSSAEANLLESSDGTASVNARVLKICPQFHQLNNIFGDRMKTEISWHEIIDNGEPIETAAIKIDADDEMDEVLDIFEGEPNNESSASNCCADTENGHTNTVVKEISCEKTTKFPKRKNPTNNTTRNKSREFADETNKPPFSYLADFQAQKVSLFKMKLEWQQKKHMEELEISRKKIALDEEKIKAEIELKKQELQLKAQDIERRNALQEEKTKAEINLKKLELEIRQQEMERNERLKVLELERDERLKKYEIEMKLKYQKQKQSENL